MADRKTRRRVLYVVACGGRPAGDLPAFVQEAQRVGWEVCVIATPNAVKFMDLARLADLTGHVVRYDYKQPDEPDVLPPADAIVVAPATFHPAFRRSMRDLRSYGVRLVFDPDAHPLPTPNLGPASRDLFPWEALRGELANITTSLDGKPIADRP